MIDEKTLLSKKEEVIQKLEQAKADVYFFQGYLKALEDLQPSITLEELQKGIEAANE